MTGECVKREQNNIGKQDERTDSNPNASLKPESANRVVPENNQEYESHVEEVTVEVL
jgi:hypothetical protein